MSNHQKNAPAASGTAREAPSNLSASGSAASFRDTDKGADAMTPDWNAIEAALADYMPQRSDKDNVRKAARTAIDVIRDALDTQGFKIVAREPTEAMVNAYASLALDRLWNRLRDRDDKAPGLIDGTKEMLRKVWDAAPKATDAMEGGK